MPLWPYQAFTFGASQARDGSPIEWLKPCKQPAECPTRKGVAGCTCLDVCMRSSSPTARHIPASCCPLRPRTTPFPEGKFILGVIHGIVLLQADTNAATPLGASGRSVISLDRPRVACASTVLSWWNTRTALWAVFLNTYGLFVLPYAQGCDLS